MRIFWCLILVLLSSSCDFFMTPEERTELLVEEKLRAVDWQSVDQYPLFESCDELSEKQEQLLCFQTIMMERITTVFRDTVFKVDKKIQDTLMVDLVVNEDGFVSIVSVQENTSIEKAIPNFKNEVSKRLNDFTTVAPALKRGVPVSMRFRLPIIVNSADY